MRVAETLTLHDISEQLGIEEGEVRAKLNVWVAMGVLVPRVSDMVPCTERVNADFLFFIQDNAVARVV